MKVLDYESGREYSLELKETFETKNGKTQSSFTIDVQIRDKTGALLDSHTVGSPNFYRPGVKNYTISQILLAPKEKGLIIVVEKEEDDMAGGVNIRYMIEALKL